MRLYLLPQVLAAGLVLGLACSARAQDGGLALDGGVPADASSSRDVDVDDVEAVEQVDEQAAREPPERDSTSSPQASTPREDATHAHPHAHVHAHPHEHDEDDQEELGVVAEVAPPPEARPVPAAASELDLQVGLLRAIPRRSADQLLTLVPGLTLGNHSGEGHAPSVFLRGFDAGEGQDIETLADGIPLNEPSNAHGHGYADVRLLIPELVRGVHVRQGPFDPRQGDFAVAGSVDYRLGVDERGILARGEYGAFDTRRLVVLWAPERASQGTFAGAEVRDSAGYGPSRASFGAGALGRLEAALSSETSAWVLAGAQLADWSSAGVVRRDDVLQARLPCATDRDSQFFCSADPDQGGAAQRYLLAAGVRWQRTNETFEQLLFGGYRELRIRENFTGRLLDAQGDGLDEQYAAGTAGARGSYRVRLPLFGHDQHLELGWIARHDSGETRAWRRRLELGTPYARLFDATIHLTRVGAHLLGELRPIDALAIRAGLRFDAFHFGVIDHGLPESDRMGPRLPDEASSAFGLAIQPRGSVQVTLQPWLDWVTSGGLGTRSSDAIALSEGERAPFAQVVATETGLIASASEARRFTLRAQGGAFHTYVDRDLIFDAARGRNVPVGSSNRFGAFLFARVQIEDWLDAAASFAWTEANLGGDYFAPGTGPRVPFVPRVTGRVDLAIRKEVAIAGEPFRFGGAIGTSVLGPRPLPNGQEGEANALVDASLSAGWRFVELGVMAQNLFDVRYERASYAYVSDFGTTSAPSMTADRHLAAGAPLTLFLTLTLHLEPLRWLTGEARTSEP